MSENKTNENFVFENPDNSYAGVFGFIWEVVKVFVLALIIIIPIRVFLFQPFFVQGASMEPNFEDGEYLIINELGYKMTDLGFDNYRFFTVSPFREFKRGDVAVFRYPKNPSQFFIKRIIGLSGETVELKNGEIAIFNDDYPEGMKLDETSYIPREVQTIGNVTVDLKEDEYFVLGDNRFFSSDSRSWGPVRKSDIIGKVFLRAWPLNRINVF